MDGNRLRPSIANDTAITKDQYKSRRYANDKITKKSMWIQGCSCEILTQAHKIHLKPMFNSLNWTPIPNLDNVIF